MTPEEIEDAAAARRAQCDHDEALAAKCAHHARFAKLSPLTHHLGEALEEAATALRWWVAEGRKQLKAGLSKPEELERLKEPPLLEIEVEKRPCGACHGTGSLTRWGGPAGDCDFCAGSGEAR